jgi:hypothetical protein
VRDKSILPFLPAAPIYPAALFGNWKRQQIYPQGYLIWQQSLSVIVHSAPVIVPVFSYEMLTISRRASRVYVLKQKDIAELNTDIRIFPLPSSDEH